MLVTGTPFGTIEASEDIYLDTAPTVYFQDRDNGHYWFNPDSDGFYWSLSGTTAYPVWELGCYEGFTMNGNVTMNAIRCDTDGDTAVVQKLDYIDVTFTLKALFPLSKLAHIIHGGPVTTGSGMEKMGLGQINNNAYYRVYFPSVYDEAAGDYVAFTGHRVQFVDSWTLTIPYGNQPQLTGIKMRLFADTDMPAAQKFATVIRSDLSAI